MKNSGRLAIACVLISAGLIASSCAQQTNKPLTNEDVLAMVNKKMPESVIVSAIKNSPGAYDTTTNELIRLNSAGVTEVELNAMLGAAHRGSSSDADPVANASGGDTEPPANQFDSLISIKQSVLQNMDTSFNNLNGQMNFQWQVAKDDGGVMAEESKIKLPGAIEVPLAEFLDGLPMYLEVSGAILIHPAITGGKEVTKGQLQIRYDGSQRFQVKSGNVNTDGSLLGDIQLGDHQDLSPTAPLGMVVAFAAPRVELALGLNKIYYQSDIKKAAELVDKIADVVAKHLLSPQQYANYQQNGLHLGDVFKNALSTDGAAYFQMIGTSASSYSGMSSITPCERYDLNLVAQVGASAEVWGQTYASASKEIFRKSMTRVDPPGMKLCENIGKS